MMKKIAELEYRHNEIERRGVVSAASELNAPGQLVKVDNAKINASEYYRVLVRWLNS